MTQFSFLCACGCGRVAGPPKRPDRWLGYLKGHHVSARSLADRFWAKVEKTDGCWFWRGYRRPDGYGEISDGTPRHRKLRTHRVAWELTNGPIPGGLEACHRCDTPACVRPDHLFLGTQADNIRDMWTKNRGTRAGRGRVGHPGIRGEANVHAKLTAADVAAIRRRYATGTVKQSTLAHEYGLTQSGISRIVLRKSWTDVP